MDRSESEREARRQAALGGFYMHLSVAAAFAALLIALHLQHGSLAPSYWLAVGWGLVLALHAYAAFIQDGRSTRSREDRQIREILQQLA